ncbi:hypothetical protein EJD97_005515, partial [Solanum chilense]
YRISGKRGAGSRVAKRHLNFLPAAKKLTGECTVRSAIRSSQIILWGSASVKHDPESRFLCQIKSSSQSILK